MMPSCDQIGVPIHLPLLDDVRVCFLDELAHSPEGFPAPVPELGDSFRDELRCRLALARARRFHVLVLVLRRRVTSLSVEHSLQLAQRAHLHLERWALRLLILAPSSIA